MEDESKEPSPLHLYKYRSLDTDQQIHWLERTFLQNEIYFPTAKQFNDPFDCYPVSKASAPKRVAEWLRKRQPKMSRRARRLSLRTAPPTPEGLARMQADLVDQTVNEIGIFSLSAKCDDVLMWSHYASSHTGICLRFRLSMDFPFFAPTQKVRYQPERPETDAFTEDANTRVTKILLTKADFWKYEEEWRMFNTKGPGTCIFPGVLLDGVILGARISSAHEALVLKWIADRQPKTAVMRAAIHPKLFRLTVTTVSRP